MFVSAASAIHELLEFLLEAYEIISDYLIGAMPEFFNSSTWSIFLLCFSSGLITISALYVERVIEVLNTQTSGQIWEFLYTISCFCSLLAGFGGILLGNCCMDELLTAYALNEATAAALAAVSAKYGFWTLTLRQLARMGHIEEVLLYVDNYFFELFVNGFAETPLDTYLFIHTFTTHLFTYLELLLLDL